VYSGPAMRSPGLTRLHETGRRLIGGVAAVWTARLGR
jgi:hypothetical protein